MKSGDNMKYRRIAVLSAALLYLTVLTIWWQDPYVSFYILTVGFHAGLIGILVFAYTKVGELKSIARQLAEEQSGLHGSS